VRARRRITIQDDRGVFEEDQSTRSTQNCEHAGGRGKTRRTVIEGRLLVLVGRRSKKKGTGSAPPFWGDGDGRDVVSCDRELPGLRRSGRKAASYRSDRLGRRSAAPSGRLRTTANGASRRRGARAEDRDGKTRTTGDLVQRAPPHVRCEPAEKKHSRRLVFFRARSFDVGPATQRRGRIFLCAQFALGRRLGRRRRRRRSGRVFFFFVGDLRPRRRWGCSDPAAGGTTPGAITVRIVVG